MENSLDGNCILKNSNGIKLLLSMKTMSSQLIEDKDYDSYSKEFTEEISNEELNKNLKEMDELIMDIYRTKSKLKLGKIKSKIKTREDLLNFLDIKDDQENKFPPEPIGKDSGQISKYKINKNSKKNIEYLGIKEKLQLQEEKLKSKKESQYKDLFSLTSLTNVESNLNDETDEIFKQIEYMDSKCEDLLDEIDSCLKLGEDIDKLIDNNIEKS